MTGTFERQSYDMNAYNNALAQSVSPFNWTADTVRNTHLTPCHFSDVGQVGYNGDSYTNRPSLVDVESELKRIPYRNTHDPCKKYDPESCKRDMITTGASTCGHDPNHAWVNKTCTMNNDYTRLTNPNCNLNGIGWNRFQPICNNPQDKCRWEHSFGIDSRTLAKDNHKICYKR